MAMSQELEAVLEQVQGGISRFEASLHPDWIEQALQASGSASIRRRKIPADQAVWLVLGMGLFADRSIVSLVDHLGLVIPGVESLTPSAVSQARYRLGPEPMAWLFNKVAETWADEGPEVDLWHGLSVYAADGTYMKVDDSDENLDYFGKSSGGRVDDDDAGYPQLCMVCLMNVRTRLLRAANFGPYAVSERVLVAPLWSCLPDNSLTILDRGFHEFRLTDEFMATGNNRHFLVRARTDLKYETIEVLADGSERALLHPNWRVKADHPELTEPVEIRVIHYQHEGGEKSRLFTSLLDHKKYPAQELIDLYHERWEIELGYDELKTHMLERKESLRSKRPEGVEQEVWGLLLAYNLVRREMLLAAKAHGVQPGRISFRSSLLWIQTFLLVAAQTSSAGTLPKHLGEFRSTLNVLILPERRSERRYPRHVKLKCSKFPRNRGRRRTPDP